MSSPHLQHCLSFRGRNTHLCMSSPQGRNMHLCMSPLHLQHCLSFRAGTRTYACHLPACTQVRSFQWDITNIMWICNNCKPTKSSWWYVFLSATFCSYYKLPLWFWHLQAICGINSVKCNLHSLLENDSLRFVLLRMIIELLIVVILRSTKHPLVPHLFWLEKCTQTNPELELHWFLNIS